jgi:hypothetical protein
MGTCIHITFAVEEKIELHSAENGYKETYILYVILPANQNIIIKNVTLY